MDGIPPPPTGGQSMTPAKNEKPKYSKNRSKLPTSFTLSDRAKDLLEGIADYYGTNKSSTVELLIRNHARELGLAPTGKTTLLESPAPSAE